MLEGQLRLTGLNREIVDAFVEEIVVYAKDRVKKLSQYVIYNI